MSGSVNVSKQQFGKPNNQLRRYFHAAAGILLLLLLCLPLLTYGIERFPKPVSFWRTALGRRLGGQSRLNAVVGFLRELPFVGRDRVWARLPFDLKIR